MLIMLKSFLQKEVKLSHVVFWGVSRWGWFKNHKQLFNKNIDPKQMSVFSSLVLSCFFMFFGKGGSKQQNKHFEPWHFLTSEEPTTHIEDRPILF
jgi:hypothetical protein